MTEFAEKLIDSALQLEPTERALVANAIWASMDVSLNRDDAFEDQGSWADEIGARIADIDSGKVKTIPSDEAWRVIDGEAEIPN